MMNLSLSLFRDFCVPTHLVWCSGVVADKDVHCSDKSGQSPVAAKVHFIVPKSKNVSKNNILPHSMVVDDVCQCDVENQHILHP